MEIVLKNVGHRHFPSWKREDSVYHTYYTRSWKFLHGFHSLDPRDQWSASMRGYYASNVVGRILASPGSTEVAHNYESIPGAIPIPATLSLELGRVISEQQHNISYRFISDYPFKNRAPHAFDDFERRALTDLRTNPNQPFADATRSAACSQHNCGRGNRERPLPRKGTYC